MRTTKAPALRPLFLAPAVLATATALALSGGGAANAAAAPVDLGTATSFAVLAYTTVTNTGPSIISGDVGLHPGSAITGFPPGSQPAGAAYVADPVALQARLDAGTAFTTASLQAGPVVLSGTELGGLTLTPDLYQSPGVLGLTGTLTLDALGDTNAIFIFRSLSALDTASSSDVQLINGADACNVFWIVPSSATLGTSSTFAGTVIATTAITARTGTNVEGRLLALNAAVNLDSTTVTSTGCAPVATNPGSGTTIEQASTNTATAAAAAAALAATGVEGDLLLGSAVAALLAGGILVGVARRRSART